MAALRFLHARIEICLKPVFKTAYCGHTCLTKSWTRVFVFLLTSYVFDILRTENFLEIKWGGQTKYLYYEFMGMIKTLHPTSKPPIRNVSEGQQLIGSASQKSSAARKIEQYIAEEFRLLLLPVISSYLVGLIHFTFVVYAIFDTNLCIVYLWS